MINNKYESPEIRAISIEPDDNLMDGETPGTSTGVGPYGQ